MKEMLDESIKESEETKKLKQDFEDLCRAGKRLFNTSDGKKVINFLKKMYLSSPVSPAGVTERYACVREGQNEVIRLLINIKQTEEF